MVCVRTAVGKESGGAAAVPYGNAEKRLVVVTAVEENDPIVATNE
jgi:hypothetical protein